VPDWQASLSLHPVNGVEACQSAKGKITPRRIQIHALGSFLSSPYALELTVPHKTVA
jgi:hypothetical protein